MQILGYIGYVILIFFALTWTLGIRVKLEAGLPTIMGALFYMVSAILLGILGVNKLHSWWLLPSGFIFVMVCTFILSTRIPLLYNLVKIFGSAYAWIIRIGIPSKKIKAVQEADAQATVEQVFSRQQEHRDNTTPFDAALKRLLLYYEACMLCIRHQEYQNQERADLAIHLYFLGAVDCSSQRHKLSEMQFANLIVTFFHNIEANELYAKFLGVFFLKMDSVPLAKKCVIEGGEHFNKWLNGNSMIPMCSMSTIKKFCDDPDFPASVGYLYIEVEEL